LYHRQLSPGIEGLLGGHRGGIMQDRCFESYYADTRVKLKMVPCSPLTNRPYKKVTTQAFESNRKPKMQHFYLNVIHHCRHGFRRSFKTIFREGKACNFHNQSN